MTRFELLYRFYDNNNFWAKRILSLILILDTFFLKIRPDFIPFNIISTIWIFDAVILVFLLLIGILPLIRFFFKMLNKKGTRLALNEKNIKLSKDMGLDFTHYYRVSDFDNAAILGDNLYIDEKYEELWTPDELSAIIAHEFSHKTNGKKHNIIFALGGIICFVFTFLYAWNLTLIFQIILVYARATGRANK